MGKWRSANELGAWADVTEPTAWDDVELRNIMFDDSEIPMRVLSSSSSGHGRTRNAGSMSRDEGGFGRVPNAHEVNVKREANLKRMRVAARERRRGAALDSKTHAAGWRERQRVASGQPPGTDNRRKGSPGWKARHEIV